MAKNRTKRIPLSKAAKKAGIKWLMVDGVKTAKEARRLEKIFIEELKKIKPKDVQTEKDKINEIRKKMGLNPI